MSWRDNSMFIKLHGRWGTEEFLERLAGLAKNFFEQAEITEVSACTLFFTPYDEDGERLEILREDGERLQGITIKKPPKRTKTLKGKVEDLSKFRSRLKLVDDNNQC